MPSTIAPLVSSINPQATDRAGAAAYLGVSLGTIDKLLASGQLRARKVDRRVLIAFKELDRFLNPAA